MIPAKSRRFLWGTTSFLVVFSLVSASFAVEVNLVAGFQQTAGDLAFYGQDVAIQGNIAVVGSSTYDFNNAPGSAYIYDFSDPANVVERRLVYSLENTSNDLGQFGHSVAISGSYVFVGAPDENNKGAVYMYDISDLDNITYQKIQPFDYDQMTMGNFGRALAVDGNRLLVGNPQLSATGNQAPSAYLIDFSDPNNMQQLKIVQDPNTLIGRFGETLDLDGNYAAIGDWDDHSAGSHTGSVYLYDLSNLPALDFQQLNAADVEWTLHFGECVAIDGETLLVKADGELGSNKYPGNWTGVVYSHDLSDPNNIVQTEFGIPNDYSTSPSFGRGVAIDGDLASIVASGAEETFLYDMSDPTNPVQLEVLATSGAWSTAMDGNMMIVAGNGVARVYQVVPEPSGVVMVLMLLVGLAVAKRRSFLRK